MASAIEKVAFGGGCFWCTEAVFLELKGVIVVTPGYAGGDVPDPTYDEVSMGKTGHAEVIEVEYDPSQISFRTLLDVFFSSHDPTSLNRQGNDTGTQYRSILLYTTEAQRAEAEAYVRELLYAKRFEKPIVTEVVPLSAFYPAEEYHRKYYSRHPENPYSALVIKPKVEKIRREYGDILQG